jgi:hypothetical protein
MTGQKEFLSQIVKRLSDFNIPYMICGSLGSSLYGEPRATNDIDIIIAGNLKRVKEFVGSFPNQDYYADVDMAEDAFKHQSMFNIIDLNSGWKADLIFSKDDEYSNVAFSRWQSTNLLGTNVQIISPEDSILSKLDWSKKGESERQFRDALGVAIVQWENLDMSYLKEWARNLGIEDLLNKLLTEAAKLK